MLSTFFFLFFFFYFCFFATISQLVAVFIEQPPVRAEHFLNDLALVFSILCLMACSGLFLLYEISSLRSQESSQQPRPHWRNTTCRPSDGSKKLFCYQQCLQRFFLFWYHRAEICKTTPTLVKRSVWFAVKSRLRIFIMPDMPGNQSTLEQ